MTNQNDDGYVLWADFLKIISIFAVIVIHSAAPLLIEYVPGETPWLIGNLYDSAARWCIPLFIMLSGTFLVDKAYENTLSRFFLRRFSRVFVPFLVWSGIYFAWRIYIGKEQISPWSFPAALLEGPVYYHLWYLYVLMGLYLVAPVLGIYLRNAPRRNVVYFLFLWLVLGSILPLIEALAGMQTYFSVGASNSLFRYLGHFVIGYLLRDVMPGPREISLAVLLFLAAFSITAYATFYLSVRSGGVLQDAFYDYSSMNVLAMAVAVYLIGKSFGTGKPSVNNGRWARIIRQAASCVPGVYLLHAMVISIFRKDSLSIMFSPVSFNPVIGVPIFAFSVLIASLILVLVIKKIPVIRRIVP